MIIAQLSEMTKERRQSLNWFITFLRVCLPCELWIQHIAFIFFSNSIHMTFLSSDSSRVFHFLLSAFSPCTWLFFVFFPLFSKSGIQSVLCFFSLGGALLLWRNVLNQTSKQLRLKLDTRQLRYRLETDADYTWDWSRSAFVVVDIGLPLSQRKLSCQSWKCFATAKL